MPCLNEARTLATCIAKARRCFDEMGVRGEVVVADNGSTDGSKEIARSEGAHLVDVPARGYGAALAAGILAARGGIIVMADADDSYDWSAMRPFIEAVRGGADLVMGNRFKGGIRPGAMSFTHRYIGNPLLSLAARIAFRAPIGDFHCGMRAFSADAYRRMKVRTTGMEFATEMVANAVLGGLKVTEVPIVLYPDGRDRPPHLRTFHDGWRHLRYIGTYAPDQLYLGPAVSALIAGGLLMGVLVGGPVSIGSIYLGIHWLVLGSLLSLCGITLLVFGALAKLTMLRSHPLMPSPFGRWLRDGFRVEQGLIAGLAMIGVGFAVLAAVVAGFIAAGGGPAEASVHPTIVAATLVVAGVELCLGAFLLRLLAEETTVE